jgi:hypothetical protein
MEVHFAPDLQAKLDKLAAETGRLAVELVKDVVADISANWHRRAKCSTAVITTSRAVG